MADSTDHLNVALYDGAKGKILRIYTGNRESLRELLSMFQALATGELASVLLHEMTDTSYRKDSPFRCASVACSAKPLYIGRIDITESEDGPVVAWAQSVEQWDDCCGLLEGLLAGSGHGHQYFSDADVEVVVALGEDG